MQKSCVPLSKNTKDSCSAVIPVVLTIYIPYNFDWFPEIPRESKRLRIRLITHSLVLFECNHSPLSSSVDLLSWHLLLVLHLLTTTIGDWCQYIISCKTTWLIFTNLRLHESGVLLHKNIHFQSGLHWYVEYISCVIYHIASSSFFSIKPITYL